MQAGHTHKKKKQKKNRKSKNGSGFFFVQDQNNMYPSNKLAYTIKPRLLINSLSC